MLSKGTERGPDISWLAGIFDVTWESAWDSKLSSISPLDLLIDLKAVCKVSKITVLFVGGMWVCPTHHEYSGVTPEFAFRNYSWRCSRCLRDTKDQTQVTCK